MIKNIIFDFGDIFINLDKPATLREMAKLGMKTVSEEMNWHYHQYEKGLVSTEEFVGYFENLFPWISRTELVNAWNAIILDFPQYRLDWIVELSQTKQYRLFLLSNINELHVAKVIENTSSARFEVFQHCFEHCYLSHEIHRRKPDRETFEFVLETNNLNPKETIFIDDMVENIQAAEQLNMHTWNLVPGQEDVTALFNRTIFEQ